MLNRGVDPRELARALKEDREHRQEPAPKPAEPAGPSGKRSTSVSIDLGAVFQAAGWAWDRWNSYQKQLADRDRRILELASQHHGWLTVEQVVEALLLKPKDILQSLERLEADGLARRYQGKSGTPVYVFEALLPPVKVCRFCDSEVVGESLCPNCGAPFQGRAPG